MFPVGGVEYVLFCAGGYRVSCRRSSASCRKVQCMLPMRPVPFL